MTRITREHASDPTGGSICSLVPEWGTADVDCAGTGDPLAAPVLSAAQRARLAALRERIRAGAVTEYPVDRRLAFARWLVQHGRLAG